jgi:CCR4-NOT transcription complex subunit 3
MNAPRSKSPQPSAQTQQQPPIFPPGVKVPQAEQQQASLQSQPPQNIGSQRPTSTTQTVPQHRGNVPTAFPGSLSDLVVSFENVKQKGLASHFTFAVAILLTFRSPARKQP